MFKHRWIRNLSIVLIILIVFISIVGVFSSQIFGTVSYNIYKVIRTQEEYPNIYLEPVQKKIPQIQTDGKYISCYGIKFISSFGKVIKKKTYADITVLKFKDDIEIIINKTIKIDFISAYDNYSEEQKKQLKNIFGEDCFDSEFNIQKSQLILSPNDLKKWTSWKVNEFKYKFLDLKEALVKNSDGVYIYDEQNIKAIQFGIPGKSDGVSIEIFNNSQNTSIFLKGKNFTQNNIYSILKSVKFVE